MTEQVLLFPSELKMDLAEEVRERIMKAKYALNTVRNYESAWRAWLRWCDAVGRASLPTDARTCIDHASWCFAEGARLSTVDMRMRAVRHYHRAADLPSPIDESVREFLRNAARDLCEKSQGKEALTVAHLRKISQALLKLGTPRDIRDRAVILLGFASGWRRSELVSLDLRDVRWMKGGLTLRLGKSKTDQTGRGRLIAVQFGERDLTCPILALQQWLALRGSWAGPLFVQVGSKQEPSERRLRPDAVRRGVKRALELIGVPADLFGAHSLRAGMITAAAEAGATETSIMQRSGHRCPSTLQRYIRPAQVFRANPLAGVL